MPNPGSPSPLVADVGPTAALPVPPGSEHHVVALGTRHPTSHGGLRLHLTRDGADPDRIATCRLEVGFLHRGVEKLFEVRDYRQIAMLADRHDWMSAFTGELGVVLAVEQMLGLEVPARAVWVRTLLAEWTRLTHHLGFLGHFPAPGRPPDALVHRERLLGAVEAVTGGRMHPMYARVGGLKEDLPDGWLDLARTAVASTAAGLDGVRRWLDDPSLRALTDGVGVISGEVLSAYGASGPVARAGGLDLDLRRDDPSSAYAELAGVLRVPTGTVGDTWSRLWVLAEEIAVSLDLVATCLDRLETLGPGPVGVRLPKVLRLPEGATYAWTEGPAGIQGYWLESRGDKTPWRLKLRTPGFAHAALVEQVVPGCRVTELAPLLASLCLVVGDIDR